VISEPECLVRDNLQGLGIFASIAINGVTDSTSIRPNPLSVAALIANCWLDRDFQARLIRAGASELGTSGISVRPDATVRILVDDTRRVHFVLARSPLNPSLRLNSLPPAPSYLQLYAYVYEATRREAALRSRLVARPHQMLRTLGVNVSDDTDVIVCEANSNCGYLSIPTAEQISSPNWRLGATGCP